MLGLMGGTGTTVEPSSAPVGVRIPAIGVDATRTVPLGLQPSGEIEVPEDDWTVGWYEGGPTPGQFGPALMGAHVDTARNCEAPRPKADR